jgi:hypothetical protein
MIKTSGAGKFNDVKLNEKSFYPIITPNELSVSFKVLKNNY